MLDLTINFAVALLIGALVGIDREKKKKEEDTDQSMGGIRTFMLLAAFGAASAWLSAELESIWIFIAALLCTGALIASSYIMHNRVETHLGLTSETAGLIVFFLGGITLFGHRELAVALGIAISAALAYKEPLHGLVHRIDRDDIFAGLKLLTATFIVLPVLPNHPIDPLGAVNPYKTWVLVILISFLSFIGYVLARWFGREKGALLTGLLGGLVSSTAVTLSFSKDSKDAPRTEWQALAAGLLVAWGIMFGRILVAVLIVNRTLLRPLVIPMAAMGLLTILIAIYLFRKGGRDQTAKTTSVTLKNPFSIIPAVKFALFFTIVLLIVKFVENNFPSEAYYVVAALAGLTDVDAITLSMADYASRGGEQTIAVNSIVIAAITNTIVKCAMVIILGASIFKSRVAIATVIILAVGLTVLWLF